MVDDTNLDVAIHHVERVLADQLNSVNSLSNNASVALGFVITVFGALFSLSRDAIHAHLAAAGISAGFLVISAILLSSSYLVTRYDDPPNPVELLRLIDGDPDLLKRTVFAPLPQPQRRNEEPISKGFRYRNEGVVLFLLGVLVFVFAV